jgi:hypothetical protein
MTLRRRLQVFIAFFAVSVLAVAIWERYLYLEARAELSESLAVDIRLDEVADQLSAALSLSIFISLILLVLAWIFLDRWVLAPLDEMRSELRLVASGTIHQIIEVANPPEIQLAAADPTRLFAPGFLHSSAPLCHISSSHPRAAAIGGSIATRRSCSTLSRTRFVRIAVAVRKWACCSCSRQS